MSAKVDQIKTQLDKYIAVMGDREITALYLTPKQMEIMEKFHAETGFKYYRGYPVEVVENVFRGKN